MFRTAQVQCLSVPTSLSQQQDELSHHPCCAIHTKIGLFFLFFCAMLTRLVSYITVSRKQILLSSWCWWCKHVEQVLVSTVATVTCLSGAGSRVSAQSWLLFLRCRPKIGEQTQKGTSSSDLPTTAVWFSASQDGANIQKEFILVDFALQFSKKSNVTAFVLQHICVGMHTQRHLVYTCRYAVTPACPHNF